MIDPELLAFVRQEIARGTPVRDFSRTLIDNGWNAQEIEHALTAVTGQHFSSTENPGEHTYAFPSAIAFCKEGIHVFMLHRKRFAVLMAGASAIALGAIVLAWVVFGQLTSILALSAVMAVLKFSFFVISAVVGISAISTTLYPQDTHAAHVKRILVNLIPFFWSNVLFFLVVSGGAVALIVPAIIMFFSYSLWPVIVVGEQVAGTRAFVRSSVFIAEHRSQYIARFLSIGLLFFGLNSVLLYLARDSSNIALFLVCAAFMVVSSVFYYIFLTVLYRSMKFAYTGKIVPTAGKRMVIIILALIPFICVAVGMVLSAVTVQSLAAFIGN